MPDYLTDLFGNISEQLATYLPRIAGSMVILLVGWIIAHLISRIVRIGALKTGFDQRLAGKFGSMKKGSTPSALLGKAAFYLIMLFVLVAFFNSLALPIVSEPLNGFLSQVFAFAPRLLSAGALALLAWILAKVVKEGTQRGLEAIDIDQKIASLGEDATQLTSAAHDTFVPADTQRARRQPVADSIKGRYGVPDTKDLSGSLASAVERARDTVIVDQDYSAPIIEHSDLSAPNNVSLAKSIPEAAYWLVLFLFLPAVLGALQMNGLLEPIQSMFTKAIGYLPNIVGAAVILGIGTFVAKLIRTVVANLNASFGVNRLADKVGVGEAFSERKLSDIIGVIAYAMVLLPVLVAALNSLDIDAVTQPAGQVLGRITSLIPGLLGAVVVLGISYVVAKIVSGVVEDLLGGVGFDGMPRKLGFTSPVTKSVDTSGDARPVTAQSPSKMAGTAVLVLIMLFATMQALPMMGLDRLAVHLEEFLGFAVQVMLGIAILALGMFLGKSAASLVRGSGVEHAARMAQIAHVAIVIFSGAIGLQRMGLAPSIVNLAFGILLGGLGLAAAIAFGWGGRDAAKRLIDRYVA